MATIKNNTMYGTRLQFRALNAAQWAEDYVLLAGEIGIELDTKKYKLGDGSTTWKDLGYYSDPVMSAAVNALTERVATNESDITGIKSRLDTAESNITNQGDRIATLEGVNVISGNDAPAGE